MLSRHHFLMHISLSLWLTLAISVHDVCAIRFRNSETALMDDELLEALSLISNATMFPDQKVDMSGIMRSMKVLSEHFKAKPFLIITKQRSGSRLLVDLLDSHPQISCQGEYFIGQEHNGKTLEDAYQDMSESVKNKPNLKWIGFKLMVGQMGRVNDLFNEKHSLKSESPVIIMHWRRNVLRRMISGAAMGAGGVHRPHPTTAQDADIAGQFKPTIPTENLVREIDLEFEARRSVAEQIQNSGLPTCPDSHFEEWVLHQATAATRFFNCLQVERHALQTNMMAIHANKAVLETVANPDDIRAELSESKYAYMLEEGLPDEIYENLKKSDSMLQ